MVHEMNKSHPEVRGYLDIDMRVRNIIKIPELSFQ